MDLHTVLVIMDHIIIIIIIILHRHHQVMDMDMEDVGKYILEEYLKNKVLFLILL